MKLQKWHWQLEKFDSIWLDFSQIFGAQNSCSWRIHKKKIKIFNSWKQEMEENLTKNYHLAVNFFHFSSFDGSEDFSRVYWPPLFLLFLNVTWPAGPSVRRFSNGTIFNWRRSQCQSSTNFSAPAAVAAAQRADSTQLSAPQRVKILWPAKQGAQLLSSWASVLV